jgi:hypothetical protein
LYMFKICRLCRVHQARDLALLTVRLWIAVSVSFICNFLLCMFNWYTIALCVFPNVFTICVLRYIQVRSKGASQIVIVLAKAKKESWAAHAKHFMQPPGY